MKLRFSHSVQNSERGKKIGNVMVTTSRNVVQTGKAVGQSVGGAFSSAKTAMSSWLSTFTSSTPQSLTEPPDGKPWGSRPEAAVTFLGLSVPCLSAAPRLFFISRRSTAGDRYVTLFTWMVALCLSKCHEMLKRWDRSRSRDGFPGWSLNWLLLFQSEPD